jgi:adenylate kinase
VFLQMTQIVARADARRGKQGPPLVLLFGGPGAGKGTQAELLSSTMAIPHISSGALLREHQRHGTETIMDRGDLLPDELVTRVVFERLNEPDARHGAILDGYPRTLEQARQLDEWLAQHDGIVKAAIYLEVPASILVDRVVGRQDVSGRGDDNPDTANRRVDVFLKELPPVLEHYASRDVLHHVNGAQPVEQVQQHIVQVLQQVP